MLVATRYSHRAHRLRSPVPNATPAIVVHARTLMAPVNEVNATPRIHETDDDLAFGDGISSVYGGELAIYTPKVSLIVDHLWAYMSLPIRPRCIPRIRTPPESS